MREIWRADVPVARRDRLDNEASDSSGLAVVRVSTCEAVVRSQMRREWSQEVE